MYCSGFQYVFFKKRHARSPYRNFKDCELTHLTLYEPSQLTFFCSKNDVNDVLWCFYCQLWTYFIPDVILVLLLLTLNILTTFSNASIVDTITYQLGYYLSKLRSSYEKQDFRKVLIFQSKMYTLIFVKMEKRLVTSIPFDE